MKFIHIADTHLGAQPDAGKLTVRDAPGNYGILFCRWLHDVRKSRQMYCL